MMFRNNKNNLYVWRNVAISCLCRYGKFDYMIANIVFLLCLPKFLNLKVFINEVVSTM